MRWNLLLGIAAVTVAAALLLAGGGRGRWLWDLDRDIVSAVWPRAIAVLEHIRRWLSP